MAVSRSRRSASGVAFAIAGAIILLMLVLSLANVLIGWIPGLAYLALAAGFGILGFGAVNGTVAKVTSIASAVGWVALALGEFGLPLPGSLVILAGWMAGVCGLLAAVVVYVGKELRNTPALVFIASTALFLLSILGGAEVFPDVTTTVIAVLIGLGLIVTGLLFIRPERSPA